MISAVCDVMMRPLARRLQANHMRMLGIARTQQLATTYNRMKYRHHDEWRHELFRSKWLQLLQENGPMSQSPIEMLDGWAMDTSLSLPHLQRVLAESDQIIAERVRVERTYAASRSFLHDHLTDDDCTRFPSLVDFATSSDVLHAVACSLRCIPSLSTVSPAGIRLVESNASFDDEPTRAKGSQLYHLDCCSLPYVCVLVLLQDTSFDHGPWTFIPKEWSMQVCKELECNSRGNGCFLSDDEVYAMIDRIEAIEFAYPRGTVLFMESSSCLHFVSRNAVKPSFLLMYGFTGALRSDFSELISQPFVYPTRDGDSLLRRLVLNKNLKPH